MKTKLKISYCLPAIVMTSLLISTAAIAHEHSRRENVLAPAEPRYTITLNLNEFSILNSAIVAGLEKYGGEVQADLKMAKNGDEIFWSMTLPSTRAFEVLSYYLAEKSTALIKSMNFDQLDANSQIALRALKTLAEKMEYAQQHPVWQEIQLAGAVTEEQGAWFIAGDQGQYQITGEKLPELQKLKGKKVIVHGFMKEKGQIEAVRFVEKKPNTLELFVMSQCPFGQRAELSLLDFLQSRAGKNKPALDIRYIFYAKDQNGKTAFTSMHGEEELQENLVQMLIRDRYPEFFHRYLIKRADDRCAWQDVARQIGMKPEAVQAITASLEHERETLLQNEYEYVAGAHQVLDGSPTFVWEGERIADIQQIDTFKGFSFAPASTESCSN